MRNTRFCSENVRFVWNPTKLYAVHSAFSARSWTAAQGRFPVRGSMRPTGFIAPNLMASCPVRATSSAGWHAWKSSRLSKSLRTTRSALTSASMKTSNSSLVKGAFR